jgi:hypothetical protein
MCSPKKKIQFQYSSGKIDPTLPVCQGTRQSIYQNHNDAWEESQTFHFHYSRAFPPSNDNGFAGALFYGNTLL